VLLNHEKNRSHPIIRVAQSLLSVEVEPVEYDDETAAPMRGIDRIIDGEIEGVVVLAGEIACMDVRERGRGARLAMTMREGMKRLHEPVVDGIITGFSCRRMLQHVWQSCGRWVSGQYGVLSP
jgi:hypothetical protein